MTDDNGQVKYVLNQEFVRVLEAVADSEGETIDEFIHHSITERIERLLERLKGERDGG